MIEWGHKSKPTKIPGPNSKPPKIPCRISEAKFGFNFIRRTIRGHESSDCFEYPKKSLLKSIHPKNTRQIFLPKQIPESRTSNPKTSFDHPRHLKSTVPIPAPPPLPAPGPKSPTKSFWIDINRVILFVVGTKE